MGREGRGGGEREVVLTQPPPRPGPSSVPCLGALALPHPSAHTGRVLMTPPSQTRKLRPGDIKQPWADVTSSRVATLDWHQDPPDSGAPAFSRS